MSPGWVRYTLTRGQARYRRAHGWHPALCLTGVEYEVQA